MEQATGGGAAPEEEAAEAASRAEAGAPRSSGLQLSAEEALVEHFMRQHLPSKAPLLDVMSGEAADSVHYAAAADAAVAAVAKVQLSPQSGQWIP